MSAFSSSHLHAVAGQPGADQVEVLIKALADEHGLERHWARKALVEIGALAVGSLAAVLDHPSSSARLEATKVLGEIGGARAIEVLIAALENPDGAVRWAAAEGLVKQADASAMPVLKALMHHPESFLLRIGAHHYVRHVQGDLSRILSPVHQAMHSMEPEMFLPAAYAAMEDIKAQRRDNLRTRR